MGVHMGPAQALEALGAGQHLLTASEVAALDSEGFCVLCAPDPTTLHVPHPTPSS